MAEKYYRPRYIRHGRNTSGKSGVLRLNLGRKILIQLFAAMLLFLALAVVSTSEVPAARFIADQVRWMLSEDWKMETPLDNIKNVFNGINDKENNSNNNANSDSGININHPGEVLGVKTLDASKPISGVVTGLFGERNNPESGELEFNCGIDILVTADEHVFAMLDGVVEEVGTDDDYGKFVKLSHGEGLLTVYARLTRIDAAEGDIIKKGDQIAFIRENGNEPGNHFHFEIWQGGMPQNPMIYLDRFYSIEPVG
jgi:murein DD-endopeptidase MepM/ murein hydrolase activator NlpD